ncbi:MAG: hypothetical protein D6677_08810 [Calditrichaeota bacterium]|nr:MAG: hypothetical protein D6677_08810 [Calditrichota bacterium]
MKFKGTLYIFIVILSVACNPFAPRLDQNAGMHTEILTDQSSPQDVMTNFEYAYNFKDSVVYSDLLDSSFIFVSKNYATTPVTDIIWGRDTDIRTTVRLFRHFQTIRLNWGGTIREIYLTEDSSLVEMKQIFQLTFDGGREIPTLNGEALFILKEKSGGIWKIVRWEDLSTF